MSEKRVVIITGAAGGMGLATVRRFLADGYRVAGIDLKIESLAELQSQAKDQLVCFTVDVTNETAARETVHRIEATMGAVYALVNLVGWTAITRFLEEDSKYWNKIVAVNFMSALYMTHSVLPAMVERKLGKIVFVTSDAGKVGQSGEAVYAGTKGGLIAFAKSMAREMARYNVNINCTAPGPTQTPLEDDGDPKVIERIIKAIPFRRRSQPDEQAAAIAFLCSRDADYITGQVLSVSGGLTMQ
jgi:2-hydroxycyclohexanecarboxyl-CoA dehydrogenase